MNKFKVGDKVKCVGLDAHSTEEMNELIGKIGVVDTVKDGHVFVMFDDGFTYLFHTSSLDFVDEADRCRYEEESSIFDMRTLDAMCKKIDELKELLDDYKRIISE